MNGKLPNPAKIQTPIALIALLGVITVALVWATVQQPALWPILAACSAAFILFLGAMLIPRFRDVLTDNATWRKLRQEQGKFRKFKATARQTNDALAPETDGTPATITGITRQLEEQRIGIYEANLGLFLGHTWRPSQETGQAADIVVSLLQHGNGPLSRGEVESVEYWMGPRFANQPEVKTRSDPTFDLDVSAFSPALCMARVCLSTTAKPIELFRYLDFDPNEPVAAEES
jgi:hypothetical protein